MLCQGRTLASLVELSRCFETFQLVGSHAAQLSSLLSCRRPASSLAAEDLAAEQENKDAIDELTFFDEPSELQLSNASAARVQQPSNTAAEISGHARAVPNPHSLANLTFMGTNVQVQVEHSLERIRTGRNIQNNLRRLAKQNIEPVSSSHQPSEDETDPCSSQDAATGTVVASGAAADNTSSQLLQQQIVQDLDSKALVELQQQQLRLHAAGKALGELHDLWQQAEPPREVQGQEMELLNSYNAVLRLYTQFETFIPVVHQQQQESSSITVEGNKPYKGTRRRKRDTAAGDTESNTSSSGQSVPANPAPALPASPVTRIMSCAAQPTTASAAQALHGQVASWERSRASVLNQLKVRQLVAMLEKAGWPLPEARVDPQTGRKKGLTKPDYIKALLKHERKVVEALLAQQTHTAEQQPARLQRLQARD